MAATTSLQVLSLWVSPFSHCYSRRTYEPERVEGLSRRNRRKIQLGIRCKFRSRPPGNGVVQFRDFCSGIVQSRASFWSDLEEVHYGCRIQVGLGRRRASYGQRIRVFNSSSLENNVAECEEGVVEEVKEDFITRTLKDMPSQLEPKYLVKGQLYTLREKSELEKPLWVRLAASVGSGFKFVRQDKTLEENVVIAEQQQSSEGESEEGFVADSETVESQPEDEISKNARPVFLADLLRQYKGNLYVPEEAFKGQVADLEEFNRNLACLPKMAYEEFMNCMLADKVELLTSRGTLSPFGDFIYWDFVVDLKRIPGVQDLQHRKWWVFLSAGFPWIAFYAVIDLE